MALNRRTHQPILTSEGIPVYLPVNLHEDSGFGHPEKVA